MKITSMGKPSNFGYDFLKLIMRTFVFLFCSICFAFGPNKGLSQNADLLIEKDKKLNIKQAFRLINKQTDYKFGYRSDLLKNAPELFIEKGTIKVRMLLNRFLEPINFTYEFTENKTLLVKRKPKVDANKMAQITTSNVDQSQVTGTVVDEMGDPLPGANIVEKGTSNGTTSDFDGNFSLTLTDENGILVVLVISYVGYLSQEITVGSQTDFNITLQEDSAIDEVVLVAYGTQKKESVVSSITSIDVGNLQAVPTSNITTALSGQMTGLISYQSTGAPGDDNAQFFIRNAASFGNNVRSPLILVDNVEIDSRQLSRLSPDDIQSFSVLKDAAATALYGARGGNGVVLITTRQGKEGKAIINVRTESSVSTPTTKVSLADPINYMRNFNEAILTRDPVASPRYSLEKIERTQDPNRNRFVYPATNWLRELTRDYSINNRANLSVSGGGKVANYYVGGSYSEDNGILKVDKINKWNTNIKFRKYTLRSNVNVNVSPITRMVVRLNGAFDDYRGPIGELGNNGRNTYYQALNADPVLFPAVYNADEAFSFAPYLLFGNVQAGGGNDEAVRYVNPYARLMQGYEDNRSSTLSAQLEFYQDLDFILEGFDLKFIGNISRYGNFSLIRSYRPYYFTITQNGYNPSEDALTPEDDGYTLFPINPTTASRFIDYAGGDQNVSSTMYGELSFVYSNTFNEKHEVGGLLVGTIREFLDGKNSFPTGDGGQRTEFENTLPNRNLGLAGRLTYAYSGKYFTEFNFGYNGSERFAKGDRFGFYPSFGVGWFISKEDFYTNSAISNIVSQLKLRGTYGTVGNDNLGGPDRFYYLSSVNLNSFLGGFFGNNTSQELYSRPTVSINSPGNPDITWEITQKANLALEIGLYNNKLSIVPEVYWEKRRNILQRRSDIPSTLGLPYELYSNVQVNVAKGFELAADYKGYIASGVDDIWFLFRGNFTYGTAKVETFDEIGTDKAPWISRVGHSPAQNFGYIAEHLFIDEKEVANSASQAALGDQIMAGDIKYVDINKDGVINQFDTAPIGYPTVPEIQFGFGGSAGYKNLDLNFFFQAQSRYSFWINPNEIAPFISTDGGNRALLSWIADNHWTESNRNLYAQWPRLSSINGVGNQNNFQTSTYFMRTASYLRLKQMEIGYTFPDKNNTIIRAYVSGTNLVTITNFNLWDPEMGGNGLAYPLQKVFNLGLQINFN